MTSAKEAGGARWKFWVRVLAPVVASLGGLVTLRLLGPDVITQEQLQAWIRPLGALAPLAFIAFLAVRPVTLLPGQVFTAVGGILFGAWNATLYALIGSLLGAMVVFVLARWLGKPLMKRLVGREYVYLNRVAQRHDLSFAALSTINPLVPTDVMIGMAAAAGARFWPTVLGTLIGTTPGTFLTASFGSSIGRGRYLDAAISGGALLISLVAGVIIGRKFARELREEKAKDDAQRERSSEPLRAVGGLDRQGQVH